MTISFITTVFNEEKTIIPLLESLISQTVLPDEIVIVDGGSKDSTMLRISNFKSQISNKKQKKNFKLIQKKGNRSVGRNEAIRLSKGDIIVCTDAGCILDKNWLKNITKPFQNKMVDVVAGYYHGKAQSILQQCVVPYILVMEDKINPENFLPATRSMAFRKYIWKKLGGFPEEYSHNEDYVFAKRLKKMGTRMVFERSAIVYWIPPRAIKKIFIMFFRFAWGDAEAKIIRPKVVLIFLRYLLFLLLIIFYIIFQNTFVLIAIGFLMGMYSIWSIQKNYKYVKKWKAFYYLPFLQFLSDAAVLSGTTRGVIDLFSDKFLSGEYKRHAIKGVTWSATGQILLRVLTVIKFAVIARVLSPYQIGLFSIATISLGFLEVFTEFGMGQFLIQLRKDIYEYKNTIWVVSIIRGVVLSGIILTLSYPIAIFFQQENAFLLLVLISIIPMIKGFENPLIAQYQKNLDFKTDFLIASVGFTTEALVSIILVISMKSPYALIYSLIVSSSVDVLVSFLFVKPIPSFKFDAQKIKEIFHFSKWAIAAGSFHFLSSQLDSIFIGRMLGANSLGMYQIAQRFSIRVITEGADVVAKVVFPLFSQLRIDRKRYKRGFIKTFLVTSFFWGVISIFLILFSSQFITILLGKKWLIVNTPFKLFVLQGFVVAVMAITSSFFLSHGRQDLNAKLVGIRLILLLITLYPAVQQYGMIGAASASFLSVLVILFLTFFPLWKILKSKRVV